MINFLKSLGECLYPAIIERVHFALIFDAGNNSRVKSIQKSFKAYPNPLNGADIQLDVFAAKIQNVEIYDLSGRFFGNLEVSTKQYASSIDNVFTVNDQIPNGTYVLRANTTEGQFSTTISIAR